MIKYLIKRMTGLIGVFLGITLISFFVIHLAPGKPTDTQASLNPKISYEARQRLEKLYGLDKPVFIQYIQWLKRFLILDFGRSYVDDRKVISKIRERLPVTLLINTISILFVFFIGIPIGIICALRRNSLTDRFSTLFVFVGFSVPEFWIALLAMVFFCIKLKFFPISGISSLDFEYMNIWGKILDIMRHITLPVIISALASLAGISRYTRNSFISVMSEDYIRTARAKGLSERVVIYRHALKNALLPVITIIGLSVPAFIGGSVIFESIFAIPGMGRLFYESVMARDYPTIMGVLSIGAVLTLLGNFMADAAYSYADPRIALSEDKGAK